MMTRHDPIPLTPNHQRARGRLVIGVAADVAEGANGSVTRLKTVRQEGSLRMLFPRPARGVEAVILNTAGGITGGDMFDITAQVGTDAHLTLTTQAAERIYRASDGQTGHLSTALTVAQGGALFWMPQETILFEGSSLRRTLDVDLAAQATFLMVEPLVFGREASGETLHNAAFHDRVSITQAGQPVYRDGVHLHGDIAQRLTRASIANGARAMANVVLCHPNAAQYLDPLRALLPPTAGASLMSDTLLVMRMLAADGYALRQTLFPVLRLLSDGAMPKNWKL